MAEPYTWPKTDGSNFESAISNVRAVGAHRHRMLTAGRRDHHFLYQIVTAALEERLLSWKKNLKRWNK